MNLEAFLAVLPVRTDVHRCKVDPDFVIVSSSTVLMGNNTRRVLSGFGCARDVHAARMASLGELHERAWGSWEFQSNQNTAASLRTWDLDGNAREVVPLDVLVGKRLSSAFPTLADATGFAFHFTTRAAIEHGVLELIERHLIWQVWNRQIPGVRLTEHRPGQTGAPCFLIQPVSLPFCLAASFQADFVGIGAKCSLSKRLARYRAIAEATMVCEDYSAIAGRGLRAPPRHQHLLEKLREPAYREMIWAHIASLNDSRPAMRIRTARTPPLRRLLDMLDLLATDIRYAVLPSPVGACVRVFSEKLEHYRFTKNIDAMTPEVPML
ncbi:YcaO-like family protein [Cupriavidus basilensis]|uniref:YcaO-like family protein n=1 Tax=Cupriavidus basilensis TaxID=68895 RepID=UPI0023E8ED36|nr:YcaO-like family protein [Cupriavidus basilensis]MDF3882108.1 YcaO-like family protein [Cupriavidus basilensis]